MNDELRGRLANWKFAQAAQHIAEEPEHVREQVLALALLFDNIGWFDGAMGVIVGAVVDGLLRDE